MSRCEHCGKYIAPKDIKNTRELMFKVFMGYRAECADCPYSNQAKCRNIRAKHLKGAMA